MATTPINGRQKFIASLVTVGILLIGQTVAVSWWASGVSSDVQDIKADISEIKPIVQRFEACEAKNEERHINVKERLDKLEVE